MRAKEQISAVFDLLKQHLKERKISYRELAGRTHMSEANVKRIFSVRSCDLERLMQFCEAAELPFFDLMLEAAKTHTSSFELTSEAEAYFIENFDCFIFMRELGSADDIDRVIASSAQPKEKIKRWLRDLEKHALIEKTREGYRFRHAGYLRLAPDSKLRKKLEQTWVPWFFKRVLNPKATSAHRMEMFSTGLTAEHREQFHAEIRQLIEKYRDIGARDQRIGQRRFESVAVCIGIGPYRIGRFDSDLGPDL